MIFLPTIALMALIFILDFYTPLGIADGILYVAPVMASSRTGRRGFLCATACGSVILLTIGYFISHAGPAAFWVAVANRLFAVIAVTATAFVAYYQMKGEEELSDHRAHLETNVAERTRELQQANILLEDEVRDRIAVEIELKESLERLAEAQTIAHLGSWEWYPETGDVYWSDELFRILGMTPGEAKPSLALFMEHIHPDDLGQLNPDEMTKKHFNKVIVRALQNHKPYSIELRCVRKDSVARIIEVRGRADLDKNGKPERVAGTVMDITERRMTEKALKENEGKYRALMQNAGDAILLAYHDGYIFEVNKKAEELLGYGREELLGLHFSKIHPPETRHQTVHNFSKMLATGVGRTSESVLLSKDGKQIPVDVTSCVIDLPGGKIAQGVFRDITERKQSEESLKKLSNAIDQASEMVVITDLNGTIEYVNKAAEKATGYKKEELIGKNPRIFQSGHYDGEFYKKLWNEISNGRTWRGELVNKKKNGELYDEEVTISPIYDSHWHITNYVAIKRIITEEKLLRRQLLHSERLSAIGTFVSGVAHELNNPLTSIIGFSKILVGDGRIPKDASEKLRIISEQADRSSAIVKGLLRYVRSSTPSRAAFRINDLVDEMVGLNIHNMEYHKVDVIREYSPENPGVFVDGTSVQQVFVNIIMNACKSMKEMDGPRTLKIKTITDGNSTVVEFENNGPRIPADLMEKIFDPFFTSGDAEDTGLGLYLSYGIVKENGGRIWAENLKDFGVRFTVSFPVAANEPAADRSATGDSKPLSGLRLLFVDDEEPIRRWMGSLLLGEGVFVQFALNGLDARKLLEESGYDAIISNIKMPVMDGFELGTWILNNMPALRNKLILTTGAIDAKVDAFCSVHGFSLLLKPYTKEEMFKVIAKVAAD